MFSVLRLVHCMMSCLSFAALTNLAAEEIKELICEVPAILIDGPSAEKIVQLVSSSPSSTASDRFTACLQRLKLRAEKVFAFLKLKSSNVKPKHIYLF